MKMTTLVLVIALVHISSEGLCQITLKEKNASLEKVLAAVERQTQYVFLYDADELKIGPVTIDVKNASLREVLEKIFKDEPVEFSVVGNNVLLKRTGSANVQAIADIRIRGKVVDSAGQPLAGVTVYNKRVRKGTETDTSGAYTLKAAKGDLLRFSFVGFRDREMTIGDQPLVNVLLEINASSTDQVVVVGYGSSRRKDLTGAVSIVDIQDFGTTPYNTFDNGLAGKIAGVEVTKTDGTPGGMVRVRIRGSSSLLAGDDPLYVIDGVPVQVRSNFIAPGFKIGSPNSKVVGGNDDAAISASFVNGLNILGVLNPDDVESVTILKDASSTAIYGSKATNGVVIITTKTGKANMRPRIETSYSSTVNMLYNPPHLLNASQYKQLITEAARNAFVQDSIEGYANNLDQVASAVLDSPAFFGSTSMNWIKKVTGSTISNHAGVSIAGGGQGSKYFSSFSYTRTPGVLDGTDYQRISGKLSNESQISPRLRFFTNVLVGFVSQDIGVGTYAQALMARPDLKPYDASGNYANFDLQQGAIGLGSSYGFVNPAALLTAANNSRSLGLLGSLSGSYDITKDLRFRSTVSLNMQSYNQRNYFPRYIDIYESFATVENPSGIGSNANSRFTDWFLENTLSYAKQKNNENALNIVVGQSYETTKYSYFTVTAAGYPNDRLLNNLSSADTVLSASGSDPRSPESYLLSFYARLNYSHLGKYLFTFTGRADGSSKFGADNKFGYFPSGAIAWRISREAFLKKVRWLSDLKLRGSYGLTGNQNIGDQMNRTRYSPVAYAGGGALIPTQLGNEQIKWESTKEADAGIDVSLLAERLYVTADYYNRQTSNALFSLPVSSSTSYSTLLQNAVGLRNRGFELTVGGDIIRNRSFRWTVSVNATWNTSLVTRLAANLDLSQMTSLTGFEVAGYLLPAYSAYGNTALKQGKPLGLLTGAFITGILKTKAQLAVYNQALAANGFAPLQLGDPIFKDVNSVVGNRQVDAIIGSGPPKCFGGMTQELTYKHFDLHCFFSFSKGGHLLWAGQAASDQFVGTANADVTMLNRYTPANTNTNVPRLNINEEQGFPTNLDVFSSSYLKLRNLTLNYDIDQAQWMKKAAVKNIRVFISATNVFTITKYPGSDPEVSDDPYSVNGGYIDPGNYPATRTFSLGFKAVF